MKKSPKPEVVEPKVDKLSPGQYWEWRCTIEEMQHAKTRLEQKKMIQTLMEKEIEIQKLRSMVYKDQVKAEEEKHKSSVAEYEKFKAQLEKDLGRSLNNTSIDDITYEVHDL